MPALRGKSFAGTEWVKVSDCGQGSGQPEGNLSGTGQGQGITGMFALSPLPYFIIMMTLGILMFIGGAFRKKPAAAQNGTNSLHRKQGGRKAKKPG
jgi:hypothetical protein